MARKKWEAKLTLTPDLLVSREKRKWQIALRRYVIERQSCPQYAPYFGLDIIKIREWFELQFEEGVGWDDFATKWQFDHILPVVNFDFSNDAELRLCWNFVNIRVEPINRNKYNIHRPDMSTARNYFIRLYETTRYYSCLKMLEKIDNILRTEIPGVEKQQDFILRNMTYLHILQKYSSLEFGLINNGRTTDEVNTESKLLNKFKDLN